LVQLITFSVQAPASPAKFPKLTYKAHNPYEILSMQSWSQSLHHMGVTVIVITPHVVSQLLSLCHMWVTVTVIAPCGCHSCRLCAMCGSWSLSLHHVGVAVTIFVPCVGCGHYHCAACGVTAAVAVVAPCGCRDYHLCATCGSQSLLSHCVWCHGCCHCATCGLQSLLLHCVGVTVVVTVVALHGCHGHCCCTAWVSWSLSLHRMGVTVAVIVLCVGCGHYHCMLPPKQADKLLPWYMQWSCDLVAEMHCRCLV